MKHKSKRWSDKAAVGSYNHHASQRLQPCKSSESASFQFNYNICHLVLTTSLSNKQEHETIRLQYSVITQQFLLINFWHSIILFGHYSLLYLLPRVSAGIINASAYTEPCAIKQSSNFIAAVIIPRYVCTQILMLQLVSCMYFITAVTDILYKVVKASSVRSVR